MLMNSAGGNASLPRVGASPKEGIMTNATTQAIDGLRREIAGQRADLIRLELQVTELVRLVKGDPAVRGNGKGILGRLGDCERVTQRVVDAFRVVVWFVTTAGVLGAAITLLTRSLGR
jgi:hypothetical protein